MSRAVHLILALVVGLGSGLPARAVSPGAGGTALQKALRQVLPAGESPESRVADAGVALGLAAPRRAARLADRTLEALENRVRKLAAALRKQGARSATGALHRQLELRHLDAGEGRALLTSLATALERASRELSAEVGSGRLTTALALEEVLRLARSDLGSLARSLRQASEVAGRGRQGLSRMLAFVEEIQDRNPASDRERVRLEVRGGSTRVLVKGIESLAGRYAQAREGLEKVLSLMKVRTLGLQEALRNLAGDAARPTRGLAGQQALADRVGGVRRRLKVELGRLAERVEAVEAGREILPELPPLPDWLFTRAGSARPPAPPADARDALELLDELEEELDRETMVYDDPLTASLAEDFRDRHGLEWETGPVPAIPEVGASGRCPEAGCDQSAGWPAAGPNKEEVDEVEALLESLSAP